MDGPEELHVIIIDNNRSSQLGDPEFQEVLNCIRCGACLNACPVYRHVGGHAYGWVYSGPIGAVITPILHKDKEKWGEIANASSLCGACYEACPVKIPLHDMLVYIRRNNVEKNRTKKLEKLGMNLFRKVTSNHRTFHLAVQAGQLGQKLIARKGKITSKIGPLKKWTAYRDAPVLAKRSFRESWDRLEKELNQEIPQDPNLQKRMQKILAERREKNESER